MPTWAPMFAFNVSSENTWRGSRLPEHCSSKEDIQDGHPQQGVGKTKTYGCYYSNARLLYTATLVKNPKARSLTTLGVLTSSSRTQGATRGAHSMR